MGWDGLRTFPWREFGVIGELVPFVAKLLMIYDT
jgi:hypothetical protein